MKLYINVFFFICLFQRIYPFIIISMEVKKVDDCIIKIELDNETNLYERYNNMKCDYRILDYNIPIFDPIPYEIGQQIKIVIGDYGGPCLFKMDIYVNNQIIKEDDMKFWSCDNCYDYGFNSE